MKNERGQILRGHLFFLVPVLCVSAFFCGIITVKEKTQYNMDMTPYSEVSVENREESIVLYAGERSFELDKKYFEKEKNEGLFSLMGEVLALF